MIMKMNNTMRYQIMIKTLYTVGEYFKPREIIECLNEVADRISMS